MVEGLDDDQIGLVAKVHHSRDGRHRRHRDPAMRCSISSRSPARRRRRPRRPDPPTGPPELVTDASSSWPARPSTGPARPPTSPAWPGARAASSATWCADVGRHRPVGAAPRWTPPHPVQRGHRRHPGVGLRPRPAGRGQGDQPGPQGDGERRGPHRVRAARCACYLQAHGALPDRSLLAVVPGLGAHRGRGRELRQQGVGHVHARCPPRSPIRSSASWSRARRPPAAKHEQRQLGPSLLRRLGRDGRSPIGRRGSPT